LDIVFPNNDGDTFELNGLKVTYIKSKMAYLPYSSTSGLVRSAQMSQLLESFHVSAQLTQITSNSKQGLQFI